MYILLNSGIRIFSVQNYIKNQERVFPKLFNTQIIIVKKLFFSPQETYTNLRYIQQNRYIHDRSNTNSS